MPPSCAARTCACGRHAPPTSQRLKDLRIGSRTRSPSSETPPPTMNADGSKSEARSARPAPAQRASSRKASTATRSPARAASLTCLPSMPSVVPSPSARRTAAFSGVALARCFAYRTSARPEAYCSQQPWLPHPHSRPSGTTRMCPNSAATPKRPRRSLLPMMMPPPRPVPSVMQMTSSWPWPAPKRYSPQAAQFASFSTTTGRPMRCSTLSLSGSCRQLMFGAKSTVARLSST